MECGTGPYLTVMYRTVLKTDVVGTLFRQSDNVELGDDVGMRVGRQFPKVVRSTVPYLKDMYGTSIIWYVSVRPFQLTASCLRNVRLPLF